MAASLPDVSHSRPFVRELEVYKVSGNVFMIVADDPNEKIITLIADPDHTQPSPTMTQQSEKTQALADHYVDQLSSWAKITTRPLFGAIALYRHEQVFAMAWHGGIYFKVDEDSRKDYEAAGSRALGYVSEGESHALKSYWEVPVDIVEDQEQLQQWAERAYRAALKSVKG